MRYRPRLANGELVPLTWPIALYRRINHICWPLEDGCSTFTKQLERFIIFIGFIAFLQHSDADLRYLRWNYENIDIMLTGAPTYLVLLEIQIRAFQLAFQKNKYKRLLQKFYAEIYVEKTKEPKLFRCIQRQLMPTQFNAICYLLTELNYLLIPIKNLIYKRKDMLHSTIYLFDFTPLHIFLPLLTVNVWCSVIIDTLLFGEMNVVAELMMHLNARYVLLRRDLEQAASEAINMNANPQNVAAIYHKALLRIIRRNIALNEFGKELEAQFTFRIFVMFSFSALMLCALCFKAYTHPFSNYNYIVWFTAKCLELLAFGMLGSILYFTTDNVSNMYYESNWHQIIAYSSNSKENVRLMKLIALSMQINSKPFFLTGLKYFRVTLITVVSILRGAFSYFTFLMSIR